MPHTTNFENSYFMKSHIKKNLKVILVDVSNIIIEWEMFRLCNCLSSSAFTAQLLPKYYESTVDASFPIKVVGNFFIGLLTIKTWPNYDVFGLFQHLKSR